MDVELYLIFFVTTVVVVLSPGAAAIAVASQGASHGARRAIYGVVGVATANVVYFAMSATGVASLVAASHVLFATIKWLGVAYLIYLGCMVLFSSSGGIQVRTGENLKSRRALFVHGFVVEFANPKALLYFAAILPQFLDLSKPIIAQIGVMGITTVVIDLTIYTGYAFMGDRLTRGGVKRWVVTAVNKVAGGALLFAGIKMASVSASKS